MRTTQNDYLRDVILRMSRGRRVQDIVAIVRSVFNQRLVNKCLVGNKKKKLSL